MCVAHIYIKKQKNHTESGGGVSPLNYGGLYKLGGVSTPYGGCENIAGGF